MRNSCLLVVLACAGTALLAPGAAHAQASVDPRALDQLQKTAPAPEAAKPATPARPAPARPTTQNRPTTQSHPTTAATRPAQPAPATPPPPLPPQVRVPLAPPPAPELPPALAVPVRPPAPPAPAAIATDAPGSADPIGDGLRITFGESRSDLNPATDTALRGLAHNAPPDSRISVAAYAPGAPEDPSTPRRLSLSRALAVRSVLIAEGIPSERIYVKALGAGTGIADGPPDRVDVTVTATNSQARSSR